MHTTPLLAHMAAMAEAWARTARASLAHRHSYSPTAFAAARRPEERALLAAAVEVFDLVRAQPGGVQVLVDAGLLPADAEGAARAVDGAGQGAAR